MDAEWGAIAYEEDETDEALAAAAENEEWVVQQLDEHFAMRYGKTTGAAEIFWRCKGVRWKFVVGPNAVLGGRPADDAGWCPGLFGSIKKKQSRRIGPGARAALGLPPLGTAPGLPARAGPYTLEHKLSDISSLAASMERLTMRLNSDGVGDFSGTKTLKAPSPLPVRDGF